MPYRVCFNLRAPKGSIFADLNNPPRFCVYLYTRIPELRPGPEPDPFSHLQSLATIAELTESLPRQLPMREELRGLATRALEAAVGDLGEGVTLHKVSDIQAPGHKA